MPSWQLISLTHPSYNNNLRLTPRVAQFIPLFAWQKDGKGSAVLTHQSLEPYRWHGRTPQLPRDQGVLLYRWHQGWHTALPNFWYKSLNSIRSLPITQRAVARPLQLPLLQEWSLFTMDSSRRPGVRGNINTPDTETTMQEVYLSLRALCFCCFILASSTWLKATSGSNWLFPSPAEAWPLKPSSPTPAAPRAPEQSRLHTAIYFGNWRMCPLSVRSHPEPTAINESFVPALRPPPPSWCRQDLSCAGRLRRDGVSGLVERNR